MAVDRYLQEVDIQSTAQDQPAAASTTSSRLSKSAKRIARAKLEAEEERQRLADEKRLLEIQMKLRKLDHQAKLKEIDGASTEESDSDDGADECLNPHRGRTLWVDEEDGPKK